MNTRIKCGVNPGHEHYRISPAIVDDLDREQCSIAVIHESFREVTERGVVYMTINTSGLSYTEHSPTERGEYVVTDLLAQAYEQYLMDEDETSLQAAIAQHGGIGPEPDLDCPIAHRIRDVMICGDWYRVVRVYNIDDRTCRLLIYPTDTPGEQAGVPYELSGEMLHRWVMDELAQPADAATDWSKYLGTLSN